jgi:hypothetical protein
LGGLGGLGGTFKFIVYKQMAHDGF